MKPPPSSPEWQPTPDILQRIYSGYKAEQKYCYKQRSWAEKIVNETYDIPKREAPSITKKALKAAIKTLQHARDPKPNLLTRMLQDQATVYRFQKRGISNDGDIYIHYETIARRYTRKYMGLLFRSDLSVYQEAICKKATDDFMLQIQQPDFTLTSSLSTYLIGILKRQIFSSGRPKPSKDFLPDEQLKDLQVSTEAFTYFHRLHRVIAKHLSQMKASCLEMILRHYNIDPALVDTVSDQSTIEQPLSMAEFKARFAIGMAQPHPAETIKKIAKELGIDPRQASRQHLTCLDELVLNVSNELFSESAMPLPASLKAILQARIDEARNRRQATKRKK